MRYVCTFFHGAGWSISKVSVSSLGDLIESRCDYPIRRLDRTERGCVFDDDVVEFSDVDSRCLRKNVFVIVCFSCVSSDVGIDLDCSVRRVCGRRRFVT